VYNEAETTGVLQNFLPKVNSFNKIKESLPVAFSMKNHAGGVHQS
jgi:hypothetical protein